MSFKSDVKAVRATATGSVFGGRTRLRGIILENDGTTTQSITLRDGNGVDGFICSCPAGDVFAFNIPEDGIVFPGGMSVQAIGADISATIILDK
jgi:hypothetical protein